ncbi:MAG: HugZ family protein [Gammaproteobacteria bacterium]|nr:HugZ family protein [Gammaproteobacteria bacterium]
MRAAAGARNLLTTAYDGVLATVSVDVAGYPFGSVVPYCLDRGGRPIVLIASIAQHTRNVRADPRVSLTVFDRGVEDLQAGGRLTVVGDARALSADETDAIERYYTYFPESRDYHLTHDFHFFRIAPVRWRYIGGFGEIFWFEPAAVLLENPFDAGVERAMIVHMNEDHHAALLRYCAQAGITVPAGATASMVGADAEGIHLRVGARIVRIRFPAPARDAQEVRAALVALARSDDRRARADR